jgi:hypothetical protein
VLESEVIQLRGGVNLDNKNISPELIKFTGLTQKPSKQVPLEMLQESVPQLAYC